MNRRRFLATGSTAAVATVAGCLDAVPGFGGDDIDTDSPEGIVESYIELQTELIGSEDAQETLEDLYHSQSPIMEAFEEMDDEQGGGGQEDGGNDREFEQELVEIGGINVATRDLSAGEILQAAPNIPDDRFDVSEELATALADEETALVDAAYTTETTVELPDEDEPETFENEIQSRFLVAVEDGDWQIVFENPMIDQ